MTQIDPITQSLETAAELAGDITQAVYARYFARCEPARELMSYVDEHMQGRMLAEVLRLVMVPEVSEERPYLDFEIDNHRTAYQVQPDMYADLFAALKETVRHALGERWTETHERTWRARLAELNAEIATRAGS